MTRRMTLLLLVVAAFSLVSACLMDDVTMAEPKDELTSGDTDLVVNDLGAADSGSRFYQGELPWCDLTIGNLTRQTPYHFWEFEGGCPNAFIDLANRDGKDMYLVLYRQNENGGYEYITHNDDYYETTLNARIDISTEASASYLLVATTYNYIALGQRVAAEYHLTVGCLDEAGECTQPNANVLCGSRGLGPCPEGMYCNWDESVEANACGATDVPGVCEPLPTTCPRLYQPVCGCNGETYDNVCFAAMTGEVDVDHTGRCIEGQGEGETCGGFMYRPCADGLVCDYSTWDFSGNENHSCGADIAGVCVRPQPTMCPAVWSPVCGCDGVTYGNDCQRRAAHVALSYMGQCEP